MKDKKNVPNDVKNVLSGVQVVVLDLDGTLYNKQGLARRMVRRLWWCLPLLAAERLARRNMHYFRFATEDEFYDAFFANMARGHWWNKSIAARWYNTIYLPAMIRLIRLYHPPRPEVLALIDECRREGKKMAIYSDYGCVEEKLEVLGIDSRQFSLLVDAPSLGALKPSKPCAEQVMAMLEAEPATTLFVGDRDEKDGETARMVGAKFLIISNDQRLTTNDQLPV